MKKVPTLLLKYFIENIIQNNGPTRQINIISYLLVQWPIYTLIDETLYMYNVLATHTETQ